ncbi:MAG: Rrf2 family transcriptional regulator [Candidatus Cloacimonetes bacterium]|nr:Rrf2 family transcriptional regulator [Candidatus Cloacimonadota bacterium]
MKISINADYILRAMYELATVSNEQPISISKVAHNQHIPRKYLEKLFSSLKKSGIVKSTLGKNGGYILVDNPENITMKKIIKAAEGQISIHSCRDRRVDMSCEFFENCIFKDFWNKFNSHINSFLNSYTLASFLKKDS